MEGVWKPFLPNRKGTGAMVVVAKRSFLKTISSAAKVQCTPTLYERSLFLFNSKVHHKTQFSGGGNDHPETSHMTNSAQNMPQFCFYFYSLRSEHGKFISCCLGWIKSCFYNIVIFCFVCYLCRGRLGTLDDGVLEKVDADTAYKEQNAITESKHTELRQAELAYGRSMPNVSWELLRNLSA